MIHKLDIKGVAEAKEARAAGAKFNPRGNNWEFEGEELPADLARFVPGARQAIQAAQNAATPRGRNIDGAQTLTEWRRRNGVR